jgi:hypothetical protein
MAGAKPVLVSVVIPAYRQADFLAETLRSVLTQTHTHFEAIVVDDASPDQTRAIVEQCTDPRVRYIRHDTNVGLPASRNTGILASRGDLVAFLDADDLFLPDKLAAHVAFFVAHPDVGATYNARFELNHSAESIREIWRPPPTVGLNDLVGGFPFAPSDMVVTRDWLLRVGLFDVRMGSAEDTDLPCRLALAGCRFAGIDRVLNSRRYHSGRGRKNLAARLDDVARALETVFADPRCPAEVRAAGDTALTHHLMVVASLALAQRETPLARTFLERIAGTDPAVLEGSPCELVSFLMMESVADDSLDHERVLQDMFAGLPESMAVLTSQREWAIGRGYLWRGLRAALWDRVPEAQMHMRRAVEYRAAIDRTFVDFLTSHLLNHEHVFGEQAAVAALQRVTSCLRTVGGRRVAGRIEGAYLVNRAFERYHRGELAGVPGLVVRAIAKDPRHAANRGVTSILLRSVVRTKR